MNRHEFQIEVETLCAMMLDADALNQGVLKLDSDDFQDHRNKILFEAMLLLWKNKEPVNCTFLAEKLQATGLMDSIGGIEYIFNVSSQISTGVVIKSLIDKMLKFRQKRKIISWTTSILSDIQSGTELEDVYTKIMDMPLGESETKLEHFKEMYRKNLEDMVQKRNSKKVFEGVETGFTDLDILTSSLKGGELIIIGARPSMGKTALVLDMARNASSKGKKGIVFSLEMSKEQLVQRIQAAETMIPNEKIKCPKLLTQADIMKIRESELDKKLNTLTIYDQSAVTLKDIRLKCREAKLMYNGLDFIVVDYLQYMGGQGVGRERVEMNSAGLKAIAKDFNIPVIVLSQLSRACEQRENKRPILSDLRESGQIEADGDIIMFLYRDEYYLERDPMAKDEQLMNAKNKAELIIAKHRNGPLGIINLFYIKECTTFRNMER